MKPLKEALLGFGSAVFFAGLTLGVLEYTIAGGFLLVFWGLLEIWDRLDRSMIIEIESPDLALPASPESNPEEMEA